MPAFFREVLVNYASNMICIRLNNCTICWKQQEFLHGLDDLQNFLSVGAIRRFIFSFFANQKFSWDRKTEWLRKLIALLLQVKFNSIIVFMKHSSAERYLANMFLPVFLWTFTKFLQRIRKMFRKFLESSQKTLLAKCFFSKVVGFYRSSHWRCLQKKCF